MSSSPKASRPLTNQSPPLQLTEWERYRSRLEDRLEALIKADPQAARAAMEMSQEHLPEIHQIAKMYFPRQWATALMNSDSMVSLLYRNPSPVKEMLQAPDLQSLLEMLP